MRRPAVLLLAALALLPACGNDRTDPPDVTTPASPSGTAPASYPKAGISFQSPRGWNLDEGDAPLIATVQTGQATVAIWRYPRSEELPKSRLELQAARDALVDAAKQRDPTFQVIKSAATKIAGKPAVQIRAKETVDGRRRTVRSTHIYADGAEVIVDAFAEPDVFRRVDAEVFRPLLLSLKLTAAGGEG